VSDPRDPFDEAFLRTLGLLEIAVRRARVTGAGGEKTGHDPGGRVEFRDHRRYAAGDDLRTVDWNVYARLERLFVKECAREEEVSLRLILDASGSMGLPGKWRPALRIAAALLYVGLASKHRARLIVCGERGVLEDDERRGEDALPLVLDRLRSVRPGGRASPAEGIAGRRVAGRRDVLLVLSDLYETERTRLAVEAAARRGAEVSLIHWLSREEIDPSLDGAVRLRDAEVDEIAPLEVGQAERGAYRARVESFCEEWRAFAGRHRSRYVLAASDRPVEELVLGTLRQGGLLR
jgi:uncharacterized protein (DUF58 family)